MPGAFGSHALEYRRAGLSVVPTGGPNGKIPQLSNFMRYAGYRAAERTIEKWSRAFAGSNLGVMAGPVSGVTAIDVDDPDALGEAIVRCGETPVISKGRRGYHLFYKFNGERTLNRLEGSPIDVRAAGGNPLVIAPPSVRPDVKAQWSWGRGQLPRDLNRLPTVKPRSLPLAEQTCGRHDLRDVDRELRQVTEGQRSKWLLTQALHAARSCDCLDALMERLREINLKDCIPPQTDAEVVATAQSAWRYQVEGRNWVGQEPKAVLTSGEIETLMKRPHAMALIAKLRACHMSREGEFALSLAMADSLGWTPKRFRAERDFLCAEGFIDITHPGGRGPNDPPRARLR